MTSDYAGVWIVFGLFGIALLFSFFTRKAPQEPYREPWHWVKNIQRFK